MAMPQCCYLAKGAKRPSHTTNTIKFDRIPFDPCNSIKRFDLSPFDQKNSTYLQPPNTDCFTVVIVFWGDWHTPKCGIPAIGYVSGLSCDEKQRNLQRSEVSEALRVDRLDKL